MCLTSMVFSGYSDWPGSPAYHLYHGRYNYIFCGLDSFWLPWPSSEFDHKPTPHLPLTRVYSPPPIII